MEHDFKHLEGFGRADSRSLVVITVIVLISFLNSGIKLTDYQDN